MLLLIHLTNKKIRTHTHTFSGGIQNLSPFHGAESEALAVTKESPKPEETAHKKKTTTVEK